MVNLKRREVQQGPIGWGAFKKFKNHDWLLQRDTMFLWNFRGKKTKGLRVNGMLHFCYVFIGGIIGSVKSVDSRECLCI